MENFRIYLSGGMSNLTFDEQTKWRKAICNAINYGDYDYEKKPVFFDPTQYYSLEEVKHKSEKEAMNFDLNALRKSDLVIVNYNNPASIGTAMEIMLAYELRIPVIGLNKENKTIHPWLVESTDRMCNSIREVVEHVVNFFLN